MTIRHGWNKAGERTTTIVVSGDSGNGWVIWSPTNSRMEALDHCRWAFRSLISLARNLQEDLSKGKPINDPPEYCRIHSFWNWEQSCQDFVKANLIRLRASRSRISTPVDLAGTTTTSFCEIAVHQVNLLIQSLWHFVESPVDPVQQIRNQLSPGRKIILPVIYADDLLRLVNIELDGCEWHKFEWAMIELAERLTMSVDTLGRHLDRLNVTLPEKSNGTRRFFSPAVVVAVCHNIAAKQRSPKHHKEAAKLLLQEIGELQT